MNKNELVNKYLNKQIDLDNYPPEQPFQCYDLANQYSLDLGGKRFTGLYASDIFGQQPDKYDWIKNTPTAIPQAGDIVVWSGGINGGVGHVAIATGEGDTNSFYTLDQNWGANKVTKNKHNYNYVIGWGRPKSSVPATAGGAMAQVSEQQIYAWLHGPGGIDDLKIQNYNLGLKIKEKDGALANYDKQFKEQAAKIEELAKKVDSLQKENDVLKVQGGYPKSLGGVFEAFMGVLKDFWKK